MALPKCSCIRDPLCPQHLPSVTSVHCIITIEEIYPGPMVLLKLEWPDGRTEHKGMGPGDGLSIETRAAGESSV
jgi:hypothetical protein